MEWAFETSKLGPSDMPLQQAYACNPSKSRQSIYGAMVTVYGSFLLKSPDYLTRLLTSLCVLKSNLTLGKVSPRRMGITVAEMLAHVGR